MGQEFGTHFYYFVIAATFVSVVVGVAYLAEWVQMKTGKKITREMKQAFFYLFGLVLVLCTLFMLPMLFLLLVPVLMLATKWSFISDVAEDILDSVDQRAEARRAISQYEAVEPSHNCTP